MEPILNPSQTPDKENSETDSKDLNLTNFSNRYSQARAQDIDDDTIFDTLLKSQYGSKMQDALEQGISKKDIVKAFVNKSREEQKKRPFSQKLSEDILPTAVRKIYQPLAGGVERLSFPLEAADFAAGKISGENYGEFRRNLIDERNELLERKDFLNKNPSLGEFSEKDQTLLTSLENSIENPSSSEEFLGKSEFTLSPTALIERSAKDHLGIDLSPKTADEYALRWQSFTKNPKNFTKLLDASKTKNSAKDLLKAFAPSPKEAINAASVGAALQYSAENEMGPLGTLGLVAAADVASRGSFKVLSKSSKSDLGIRPPVERAVRAPREPLLSKFKKYIARTIAINIPKEKKALQQQLAADFKASGIQVDVGTLTGGKLANAFGNFIRQSALTGEISEAQVSRIRDQITQEYKSVANSIGEDIYTSRFEAGQALKDGLAESEKSNKLIHDKLYKKADQLAGEFRVPAKTLQSNISSLEKVLKRGGVKSPDKKAALKALNELTGDITGESFKTASIKDLIESRKEIQNIIQYEIQGGQKKLLKGVVSEIDKTIERGSTANRPFSRAYKEANSAFKKHIDKYRSSPINKIYNLENPDTILSKMDSAYGVRKIKEALNTTEEGKKLFKDLSRFKVEEILGKNFAKGVGEQVNYGKFNNSLINQKTRSVLKELMGEKSFVRLERLSKNTGAISKSLNKFYNASKSGAYGADAAAAYGLINSFAKAFSGNPFPFVKGIGILIVTRQIAKFLTDPEFLKLLEDAILSESKSLSRAGSQAKNLVARANKLDPLIFKPSKEAIYYGSKYYGSKEE